MQTTLIKGGKVVLGHAVSQQDLLIKGQTIAAIFVEIVATTPARLFGMPQKGTLLPGADADIVLFDPAIT